jgi:hypothetical protein
MHGNVVFRGPRVKMGIYSGVPTRVLPHSTSGRADYFGPLVNRAARYCPAAARGGQVSGWGWAGSRLVALSASVGALLG